MSNDRQRLLPIEDDLLIQAANVQSFRSPLARVEQAVTKPSDGGEISIRETVPPVALLLYLRWLDHQEREREAVAAFDRREYSGALPQGLLWREWSSLRGKQLTAFVRKTMLPSIAAHDDSPLAARVRQLEPIQTAFLRLPDALRDELLDIVASLPFETPADWQAAEALLAGMIARGATPRSAFYTPPEAVELILELAQPQPGDRIYDPCFGSGSLLAAAARRLRDDSKRLPSSRWEELRRESIFGVEIDAVFYFVGLVRVILAGIDHPGLELGDALERTRMKSRSREGFDCVIANPPWRSVTRAPRSSTIEIQTSSSEGLFVQHIVSSLRPGGRAVIALPESFLFSSGPEQRIRKYLLEEFQVDGVIGLPAGLYKPYASIKSSLVVVRRGPPATNIKFMRSGTFSDGEGLSGGPGALTPRQVADRFRLGKVDDNLWIGTVKAIARREWDLSPKPTGQEDLDGALEEVVRADPQVRILRLEEAAELIAGIKYRREDVVEPGSAQHRELANRPSATRALRTDGVSLSPSDEPFLTSLIRAGDVASAQVGGRPPLLLADSGLREKWKSRQLRAHDVLITSGGSIGKVAIAPDQWMGGLPSTNVVAMRVKDGAAVDPAYLAALLRSALYQEWLAGHAQGAVIQRLATKALRDLPIPLPSLPVQERVAAATREGKADALDELLRILTSQEADSVSTWLQAVSDEGLVPRAHGLKEALVLGAVAPLAASLGPLAGAISGAALYALRNRLNRRSTSLVDLEDLSRHMRALRHQLAHAPGSGDPGLREWAMRLASALERIEGISQIPPGSGRLNILERSRDLLARPLPEFRPNSPSLPRAKRLNDWVLRILGSEIEALLADIRIVATLTQSEVPAGVPTPVVIAVKNAASLPLRYLQCEAQPHEGRLTSSYLAEGDSKEFTVEILALDGPQVEMRVNWTAERLDGKPVAGVIPLSLAVVQSVQGKPATRELGENPYISTGTPVDRPEMLFGRRPLIDQVKLHLANKDHAAVIFLQGNRRAGKSSILWQLRREPDLNDWLICLCDLQDSLGERESLAFKEPIFYLIARSIAEAGCRNSLYFWPVGQSRPESFDDTADFIFQFRQAYRAAVTVDSPFEVFRDFVRRVLEAIEPKRVLLMLDEFDKVPEGIEAQVISPEVPQNLRSLVINNVGLGAIFAGSRRMLELQGQYRSALFGLGLPLDVTAIDRSQALQLVTEPVSGALTFATPVAEQVVDLCAQQPYLIQMLCSSIFDQCARTGERSVSSATVETAADELVTGWAHLDHFWVSAGSDRARYLLFVIDRLTAESAGEPASLRTIEDELERTGVPLDREELVGDYLQSLMRLELVANEKDGRYRIAVPLFSLWMNRNKDYQDQLERAVREATRDSIV